MSQDKTLNSIANWFAQAVPTPTPANLSVQIGCHFEEVAEMAEALGFMGVAPEIHEVADMCKRGLYAGVIGVDRKKELLDALCDQIVTAIGVAHMLGMNIQGALDEVDRSNWSKFKDGVPVFDANGKIAKNLGTYFKADMSAFV